KLGAPALPLCRLCSLVKRPVSDLCLLKLFMPPLTLMNVTIQQQKKSRLGRTQSSIRHRTFISKLRRRAEACVLSAPLADQQHIAVLISAPPMVPASSVIAKPRDIFVSQV